MSILTVRSVKGTELTEAEHDNNHKAATLRIENRAELITKAGDFDNQTVNMAGYYTQGGGQLLYWDATSTETDNGGTIFQVTGVTIGRWKSVDSSGVLRVRGWGCKCDGGGAGAVDDSTAFDAMLSYCWTNYTKRFTILVDDGLRLNKAGDFDIPPNVIVQGNENKSRIYLGNALSRLYMKRDNTRVAAAFQSNSGYWSLGSNELKDLDILAADTITVTNAVYISNLIRQKFLRVNIDDIDIATGIIFENTDSLWTEFWEIQDCEFQCGTACVKFIKSGPGGGSFGHGNFRGKITVQSGQIGIHVTDGAGPYHAIWEINGFVQTQTAATKASMFSIDNGGAITYGRFNVSIESLLANGTNYAIEVDTAGTPGLLTFGTGIFSCVSTTIVFTGLANSNSIKVIGSELYYRDGVTTAFQGSQYLKTITGEVDGAGRNLLYPSDYKTIVFTVSGTITANQVLLELPRNINRQMIIDVQMKIGTASSANTGAIWSFGLRKSGATNPTIAWSIADGSTTSTNDELFYAIPSAWYASNTNEIVARSIAGTGNDGTGPSDITFIINYQE